ncbi:hypothetical protein ACFLR8_02275 [Bacteroidota bacterium]
MACLSDEQISFIRSDLKSRNESRSFLFEEWGDHVCCDVESLMIKGILFEDAYRQVAGETGSSEIRSAHGDVQQFLNHRYVGIKKLLLFAFLLFASSWIINLQGAGNWIGLVSFLILGIVYLRISSDFFRKRFVHKINILLSAFSFLSFIGTISGIVLIFLNRNFGTSTRGHGVDLTVFGWFFFSLVCLVYLIREYRSAIDNKETRKFSLMAWLSGFNLFLAAISIASFPLYRQVQAYLFFLILFILGFNSLVLMVLFLTRSMKNTLVLSLVIGSFMIVFIHSQFRQKLPGGKPKLHQLSLQLSPIEKINQDNLYITMYYDRFPDKPITLPLQKMGGTGFGITMPSYAYKGYLYYAIMKDSMDARQYLSRQVNLDSIRLNIPRKKLYPLNYTPE